MRDRTQPFWNQKLPSLLGLLVLVGSLATIFLLSRNAVLLGTRAATANIPKNIQVSNITDTSFTVSYTTDEKVIGAVAYGSDDKVGNLSQDEREVTNKATEHKVHSFTIKALKPSTNYFFSVLSGTETFSDGGKPYSTATASNTNASVTNPAVIKGKVTMDGGAIPTEGIVYASSSDSQLISVLLQPDGTYTIPLNGLRTKNLASFVTLTEQTPLDLIISNGATQSAVTVLAGQANPVPPVVLSQNYDFSLDTSTIPNASSSASITGFPTIADTSPATEPAIQTPAVNSTLKDAQPTFKGKALPNATVAITINSDTEIKTTVTADSSGNWQYRPTQPLESGNHTVTIETPNAAGIMQMITNNFTVFAVGSEFTEPSVKPTAGPTEKPKPTVANTTPTTSPTMTTTPTTPPTLAPTEPLASTSALPTVFATQSPIAATGNDVVVTGLITTGLFVLTGVILFFFSGGIL